MVYLFMCSQFTLNMQNYWIGELLAEADVEMLLKCGTPYWAATALHRGKRGAVRVLSGGVSPLREITDAYLGVRIEMAEMTDYSTKLKLLDEFHDGGEHTTLRCLMVAALFSILVEWAESVYFVERSWIRRGYALKWSVAMMRGWAACYACAPWMDNILRFLGRSGVRTVGEYDMRKMCVRYDKHYRLTISIAPSIDGPKLCDMFYMEGCDYHYLWDPTTEQIWREQENASVEDGQFEENYRGGVRREFLDTLMYGLGRLRDAGVIPESHASMWEDVIGCASLAMLSGCDCKLCV